MRTCLAKIAIPEKLSLPWLPKVYSFIDNLSISVTKLYNLFGNIFLTSLGHVEMGFAITINAFIFRAVFKGTTSLSRIHQSRATAISQPRQFPEYKNPEWIFCHPLDRGRSGIHPSRVELRLLIQD